MIVAVLIFLLLLLLAYGVYVVAGHIGAPHPLPAILALVVVILAIIYLAGHFSTA